MAGSQKRYFEPLGISFSASAKPGSTLDSGIGACADIDATEIGLLSELYWGLPMRTYSRTRAWTEAQFDAAHERLKSRGLVDDTGFTPHGHGVREQIEHNTDRQMDRAMAAIGSDIDELVEILLPWGAAIRGAQGYPASGPHDLADAVAKQ